MKISKTHYITRKGAVKKNPKKKKYAVQNVDTEKIKSFDKKELIEFLRGTFSADDDRKITIKDVDELSYMESIEATKNNRGYLIYLFSEE